ncbi:hypothetical protein BH10CYA1_BH10CYA1_08170 [soil metagenome]
MSAADGEEQPISAAADPKAMRASYLENVGASMKHIQEAMDTEGKKLRGTDYISVLMLPIASVMLAICSAMPGGLAIRPFLVTTFCLALLYFIGARIGILRALTLRQTHLILSIISATFMLGASFALLMYEVMRNIR